jgi:hypothetical protein
MAASVGLGAVSAATLADELLAQGEPLQSVWRYVIVQLLDDCTHDLARSGATAASQRFTSEPPPTSSAEVDAALAALAEHLARRDNWELPTWARKPGRYSPKWWFVTPLRGMHATALQESPPSFRTRGVFITAGALSREAPGLLVEVASAEYLLAMKLFSSRVETDAEDIALLYREVGYRTVEEGLALVERSYPGRPIAARVQFLLAEIVEALNAQ